MFTGLVQDVGTVMSVTHRGRASRLAIKTQMDLSDVLLGESIAVNGACFTVVEFSDETFAVDVSPESLDRTTTGALRQSDRVHLERALRLSDRLGGHLVLGHVDGVGQLKAKVPEANAWHLSFAAPPEVTDYLIPKGCIAVDGVSLTVNSCDGRSFSVTIVPHTTDRTNLLNRTIGDRVNLEADVIGKYVAKLMGPTSKQKDAGLLEALATGGFIGNNE